MPVYESVIRCSPVHGSPEPGDLACGRFGSTGGQGSTLAGRDDVDSRAGSDPLSDRLVVRDGSRVLLVRFEDIDWIEASGTYVRLHTTRKTHLVRASLGRFERRLRASGFFRIHRSTLVNLARIAEVRHESRGDYRVVLDDGTRLRLTRRRRKEFETALGVTLGSVNG